MGGATFFPVETDRPVDTNRLPVTALAKLVEEPGLRIERVAINLAGGGYP